MIVDSREPPAGHPGPAAHARGLNPNGVGRTTGTEYVSNEHFNFVQHSGGGGATNLIIEFTISSVSKGPLADGGVGTLQIFVVVNANGEMTVDRFVLTGFECRG